MKTYKDVVPTEWCNQTVSRATCREQDLIPVFANLIDEFVKQGGEPREDWAELKEEIDALCAKDDDDPEWISDNTSWLLNEELFSTLENMAPAGYYFGAHEGDGSDFGFWSYCDKEQGGWCDNCPHADNPDLCPESDGDMIFPSNITGTN